MRCKNDIYIFSNDFIYSNFSGNEPIGGKINFSSDKCSSSYNSSNIENIDDKIGGWNSERN